MKATITKEQAGEILLDFVNDPKLGDVVHTLANTMCDKIIAIIEEKYNIVGASGEAYTDDDTDMWYDEFRDDFIKKACEKIMEGKF